MHVFKICRAEDWKEAQRDGVYAGSKMDRGYGCIHLCTEEQIPQMIGRFTAKTDELLLLEIDSQKLGGSLRFERTRTGGIYPHLYDSLPVEAVVRTAKLTCQQDGKYTLQ